MYIILYTHAYRTRQPLISKKLLILRGKVQDLRLVW